MMRHFYVNANKNFAVDSPKTTTSMWHFAQKERVHRQSLNHGKPTDVKIITVDEVVGAIIEAATTIGEITIAIAEVAVGDAIITIITMHTITSHTIADTMATEVIAAVHRHTATDHIKKIVIGMLM